RRRGRRPGTGGGGEGARRRGRRGDRGRSGPPSGLEGSPAGIRPLMGFNPSAWALKHRSFVVYCMIAASLAGAFAFYRLGRAEDPPFTIRTMVVKAAWPGATIDETLLQVTERLERTLEETPHLDFLRSFTKPGVTTIFVTLKGATTGRAVDDTWYHV